MRALKMLHIFNAFFFVSQVETRVEFSDHIKPLKLAASMEPNKAMKLIAVGWGHFERPPGFVSKSLHYFISTGRTRKVYAQ